MKDEELITLNKKATAYIKHMSLTDTEENIISKSFINEGIIRGINLMFFWIQLITEEENEHN